MIDELNNDQSLTTSNEVEEVVKLDKDITETNNIDVAEVKTESEVKVLKPKKDNKAKLFFKKYWNIIKEEFTSDKPSVMVKNVFLVILGTMIVAFAYETFYFPLEIVTGGISGLSIIFSKLCLSESVWSIIFTWFFFFLGLICLGFKFSLKTIISTVTYSVFALAFRAILDNVDALNINQILVSNGVINDSGIVENGYYLAAYLICGCFGGLLTGLGVALTFIGGGSTGGVDILILMLEKFVKLKASIGSFLIDAIILLIGFFVLSNNSKGLEYTFLNVLVGIIAALLCSLAIGKFFIGNSYYCAFITSLKWRDISYEINHKMGRGTTLLKSQGGFSGKSMNTIMVCFSKDEINELKVLIHSKDENAFVTILNASEINGDGFKKYTTKKNYFKVRKKYKSDIVPLEEIEQLSKEEIVIEDLKFQNIKENAENADKNSK